jgi:hypothetical protein
MDRVELLGELLTALELEEVRLMEWGFFDVAHTGDEVASLFSNHPELGCEYRELENTSDAALLVDDLAADGLLYKVDPGPPARYRSRFAESARLLIRLRQRFRVDDWSSAPELVSDARFHLGPRRFPVRNIDPDSAWESIRSSAWIPALQRRVIDALLGGQDSGLMLAPFQVRACDRVLRHYHGTDRVTGTVVTAGTGGGKTKAFYIPALMGIAADLETNPTPSTKVLSIYPRNVLLADQFAEAAANALTVNRGAREVLSRPITVGALLGGVPLNRDFEKDFRNRKFLEDWVRPPRVAGYRVPYIQDAVTGKPLIWLDEDRQAGRSTLRLESDPSREIFPDGLLVLTRDELQSRPPDILLTSIEMLNKEMSSNFGVDVLGFNKSETTLRLVLLDEIHTYEGLTGAQVPWILRRLSYWTAGKRRRGAVHFVGLSATLQDAPHHMSMLCGASEAAVVEISPYLDPNEGELSIEGQEYNVVLKSHPSSGAGVLATSIQTMMLGGRLLSPVGRIQRRPGGGDANYFFGQKVFGFTDNLDVANRWFPDLWNAERQLKLAALRQGLGDRARRAAGQEWDLSERVGHDLTNPLRVARTTGQDSGVDASADIIVATSALEVGFDDARVGMVVQHKAPRNYASFLQRKGRAGRKKGMRPWTIVVLTDHGRDRWVFRDSEKVFSPTLERLRLPVLNPYVLRIQATWFLVDWIAGRVGGRVPPSLYLAREKYMDGSALRVLTALVNDPKERAHLQRDMTNWIRSGEGQPRVSDPDTLAAELLWTPPRAVLRDVVPVLWNHLQVPASDERLLPRFLPRTTFDVLDTQDVLLEIPNSAPDFMDVGRALRECPPGRVTRRFSVERTSPSLWLEWSQRLVEGNAGEAGIDELFAEFSMIEDLEDLRIFQPTQLRLAATPTSVKKSSNSEWAWHLKVVTDGNAGPIALHAGPVARTIFRSGASWLHNEQSRLLVYRYANSFRFETLLTRGESLRASVQLTHRSVTDNTRLPAVGYKRAVDGIRLEISADVLSLIPELPPDLLAALRPLRLKYLLATSTVLLDKASVFTRGLLANSAIGATVATALKQRLGPAEAWERIPDKSNAARKVLSAILSAADVENDTDDAEVGGVARGISEVVKLWKDPEVLAEMNRCIPVLWEPPGPHWGPWLQELFLETVRSAVEAAVQSVLPEVPDSDFSVEVEVETGGAFIWIFEADPGGVGIIARVLAECDADPTLFDTALESALFTCEAERTLENALNAVRQGIPRDSSLRGAFDQVRSSSFSYAALNEARVALVDALEERGLEVNKEAVTAIVGKVLMPGSNNETDRWIRHLTAGRRRVSNRLGIAIDSRLWAYWTLSNDRRRRMLTESLRRMGGVKPNLEQLMSAAVRMTLEPCKDSCPECLGTHGELRGIVASRRLALEWLIPSHLDVVISTTPDSDLESDLRKALESSERVRLQFTEGERDRVGKVLSEMLARRFDRGYLLSGFRIAGTRRQGRVWETLLRVDGLKEI